VSIDGSTIYVTNQPCILCAKMIINAGIVKVVYSDGYPDELAKELLDEAGVEVVKLDTKEGC
jgi:dCMP deaminase